MIPQQHREALAEIADNLACVLKPAGVERWWSTSISALQGLSPIEAVSAGRIGDVVELTRSYRNPDFT